MIIKVNDNGTIKSCNVPDVSDIPTKVSDLTNDSGYLTEHQDISGKANIVDLATVASSGSYNDLLNKPTIPTKVSDLTNDSGFISIETDPTVPLWAKAVNKPNYTASEVGALPNDTFIPTKTSDLTNDSGYLTEHQDISGKANIIDLATIATSGNYNDLSNKPTIPTKISDLTDDSNHYIKPSNGIPASDLADGVIPDLTDYVKNTDYATTTKAGIVKVNGSGVQMVGGDRIAILPSTSAQIKAGTASYAPIGPALQHEAAFYGLAKAAGDTTQSSSSNAVGTYTNEAKSAIRSMLGVENATVTVEVQGTSPTITAQSNVRYTCGEVTSITITPPQIGICDVIFTSGSTPAILTLPNTIKMPDWVDLTILEANTIYEINIVDGIYGTVMTWTI